MSIDVHYDIRGLDPAERFLNRLADVQTQQLLAVLGELVAGQNRTRVLQENQGPNGEGWAPLSPAYANSKQKAGKKLLVLTGAMAGSIGYQVSGNTAIVGPSAYYAGFVHGGTSKMAARPFIGVSQDNATEIQKVIQHFVTDLMGAGAA